ncbi:Uncharacterized protein HZ326_28227 [Fusarium oxysporum f. sp. albedinis]|nr:Uncharacterized protein HZ326_28227 [Fusarium oxysporum f. sp. albedinis]
MNSVLVPYTRYHDFVERSRSRILKDLKPQFGFGHKSTTKRRLRVSLYGLRGIRYRSLWARQQWTHRSAPAPLPASSQSATWDESSRC